eukprot:SAG25_NODE_4_length_30349_cov_110.018280_10_plen_60_part_00
MVSFHSSRQTDTLPLEKTTARVTDAGRCYTTGHLTDQRAEAALGQGGGPLCTRRAVGPP